MKCLAPLIITSALSQPAPAEPPSSKEEEIILITTAVADLASTEWALSTGRVEEGNPFLQDRKVRLAAKAAVTGLIIFAGRQLERDGHPKAAKWLRRISIGANASAAGWNIALTLSTK